MTIDPASLTPEQVAELEALAKWEAEHPAVTFWVNKPSVGGWGISDWQRAVALDPSSRIFIRKGNKVGGSGLSSWTIKAYLDGWHPTLKRPDRPVDVLYVAADLDTTYKKDVSRRLREFFTDRDLSKRCSFDRARGFMVGGGRGIETASGDIVSFVSGTQAALSLSGSSYDLIIVNEPPRPGVWGEVMRAAAERAAPVLVNFTPLPPESLIGGDDLEWFRKQIESDDGGWSQHVVPLRYDTAPHRRPEDIDQQIADMFPWERAQRRDGAWQGPAPDRRFACFDDSRIFRSNMDDLPGRLPSDRLLVGLGGDHGELTGREAWTLAVWAERPSEPVAWILDCYVSPGRTTVEDDAHAVAGMLSRWGLDLLKVDEAVGDVNSAGKSSEMDKVNGEFEQAFASLAGMGKPPFRIDTPEKGAGSVAYGVHVLDESFGAGRLFVHEAALPLIQAFRRWRGKHDKHSHVLDGARYVLTPVLAKAWRQPLDLGPQTAVSSWTALGVADPAHWGGGAWDGSG